MNEATADTDPDTPAAWLERMWDNVFHWVVWLDVIFPPGELRREGLSRRHGLICRSWLWSLESLVRRIIICAALLFDLSKLRPLRPRKTASGRQESASTSRIPFRLLAWARPGAARAGAPQPASGEMRTFGDVGLPADALLRLGAQPGPGYFIVSVTEADGTLSFLRQPQMRPRSDNPLHRRGRRSRFDPDGWVEDDYPLEGRPRVETPGAPGAPSGPRPQQDARLLYRPVIDPGAEWRRIEEEWEKINPADRLANRVETLLNLVEKSRGRVARLARRLRFSPDPAEPAALAALPEPIMTRKLDRPAPFLDPLVELHAFLQRLLNPDTS